MNTIHDVSLPLSPEDVAKRLNMVFIEVTCPSGSVARDDGDDDDAFTAGACRYISRKVFRPFVSARSTASRACIKIGTRFLGAYAVADDKIDDLRGTLQDLISTFHSKKESLEVEIDEHLSDWMNNHPEIASYKSRFPTSQDILDSISMKVSICKVAAGDLAGEGDGLNDALSGIRGTVLHEIAQDAKTSFDPASTKASSKVFDILGRFENKLRSLSFVDHDLAKVADMIASVGKSLPQNGQSITGQPFDRYRKLMQTLSDPAKVVTVASFLDVSGTKAGEPVEWPDFGEDATNQEDAEANTEDEQAAASATETGGGEVQTTAPGAAASLPLATANTPQSSPPASAQVEKADAETEEDALAGVDDWNW